MIFDASTFSYPMKFKTDLLVVGSGAGGLTAAMTAAEGGIHTLVLEGGAYLTPKDMSQREEDMFPKLLQDSGSRTSVGHAVKVHQGRGVGGSTLHNLNLCKRIPAPLRAAWSRDVGLSHLPSARWDELYADVEAMLRVSVVPEGSWNRHNRLLQEACAALGWKGGGLSHNRTGCLGSGFCEVGCRYNAKNNAFKVMLPRALAAGAQVLTNCVATRLVHERGAVSGVEAVAVHPTTQVPLGRVTIVAQRVCLAASATGTPALLRRSEVPDPSKKTGTTLRLHPSIVVAGDFKQEVRAWEGIPQTYECSEYLRFEDEEPLGLWIVPAFAHPVGTATMIPFSGAAHRAWMQRYAHLGVFTAMIHDSTLGEVRPEGELGLSIRYWPNERDRAKLSLGAWACAKLLGAAGAQRVMVPTRSPRMIRDDADLGALKSMTFEPHDLDVVAVHPMSSVPMGDDPRAAPVGSDGRHHHLEQLWVADASLFPTSIGTPPQLSVYALGRHVGQHIVRNG
jgi:choline dehydrogenase-like flavoprotein